MTPKPAFSTLGAMPRRLSVRAWAVGSLLSLAAAGPGLAQQERAAPTIYKWVDTNGIAHYTTDPDDIPSELRSQLDGLRRARSETPRESPPSLDPDDPWAAVSVEDADELWVVQDSLGDPEELEAEEPFGTGSSEDPARRERRRQELAALDQQIADLQARIAADEDVLKDWIANPDADPVMAADDDQFREIALRLPRLHGDLAELEEKRRAMGGEPEAAAP